MSFTFQKATKAQAKLRLALVGPSGSGKTFTALTTATTIGKRVAVIDTEHGSASLYADRFTFDALNLTTFAPQTYVQAIKAAADAGYDCVVIDSLSHAWSGKDGALEQVDKAAAQNKGNSYTAWRNVTPAHNALIDAIVGAPIHVIATMRSKTEYVLEEDNRGKKVPRKVGMAPVQRDGMEYEFGVVAEMDHENRLVVTKTRCPALAGYVQHKPDAQLGETLLAWLNDGDAPAPKATDVVAAKFGGEVESYTGLDVVGGMNEAETIEQLDAWAARARGLTDAEKREARQVYAERKAIIAEDAARRGA